MTQNPVDSSNTATPIADGTEPDKSGNDGGTVDSGEKVSLAPLGLAAALSGLLAIPNPDATKPKHKKAQRKGGAK